MSRKQRERIMVELPKGVHRVVSRGKEYYYYHPGRGTEQPGKPVPLPRDPRKPEFWQAVRQAQGVSGIPLIETVGAAIDAYLTSPAFTDSIGDGTREVYRRELETARRAWGNLPAEGVRPMHVQAVMDALAKTPGKANAFLGTMRALSKWARTHGDPFGQGFTEGVTAYPVKGGHKPWTEAQIAAREKLTGMVRRGVFLAMYTGQRGSDVVRLGWTNIDDGGFTLRQRKTGVELWCPIVPELAAEMAAWEKRPGPFLLQESGAHYRRKLLDVHFALQRESIPELAGATLHGLRATAVVRLRREGLTPLQIQDIVGMSVAMIQRYCRFADKKASGQAALYHLTRTAVEPDCKTMESVKTKG